MVVTFLPCAAEIGVTPARVGVPSRCTVQAPQSAMPHPNFVPVSPSSSRSAQSSGVSAGTSRLTALPLMSMSSCGSFPFRPLQNGSAHADDGDRCEHEREGRHLVPAQLFLARLW